MLAVTAYTLATVLALFVAFIGARFLLAPRAAAAGYGVPAEPDGDLAYLEVKGVRDLTFGVLGLALIAFAGAHAAAWYMLVVALAPLGDTLIVLRHGGTKAAAFGIHFATAVTVLVSAALLFAV
ncbi:small membrane hydrophobic protein [Mycobacterium tuberculosis]|nr:small membrane hydrophobic protein [Mycobacterium tuberculosis]